MHMLTFCSVLLAVAVSSSSAIFDNLFAPQSGCTVLADVPTVPYHPYFKAEAFRSLKDKLDQNQSRFDRDLRQVWVDAPDYLAAQYCSNLIGNVRCCLNAHFPPQYEWRVFKTGDAKQAANAQLLQQHQGLPFYRVWVDAPERYCKRGSNTFANSIADFFG